MASREDDAGPSSGDSQGSLEPALGGAPPCRTPAITSSAAHAGSEATHESSVSLGENASTRAEPRHEAARLLTSQLDSRAVTQLAAELLVKIWAPSHAAIVLRTGSDLRLEAVRGEGVGWLVRQKVHAESSALARSLATRRVARGEGRDASEVLRASGLHRNTLSSCVVLAAPIVSGEELLGAVELVAPHSPMTSEDEALLQDLTEYLAIALSNARQHERILELTIRDDLTGLYNARHLQETLSAELTRAARFQRPLSVVFMDLDFFKAVNDSKGHLIGSALLGEFGGFIARHIRKIDLGFRYGGDEFAVLLVETAHDGALAMANRFRKLLKQQRFLTRQGLAIQLTASIGVATYPDDGRSTGDLLSAADRAMYKAKELGRDEVFSTRDLA